ncbi:type II secretion system F family protein [Arthrobacter sp. KK5.5]|uniref:type II secretion system F family protein n=1 Tax=Arthrobacter sp. KK5.5 TaxID=3373084 RepID=UPI003EE7059F
MGNELTVLLAAVFVASSLALITWTIWSTDRKAESSVHGNLRLRIPEDEVAAAPEGVLLRLGRRVTPDGYVKRLDRLLALAGRPASIPLDRVLAGKVVLGLAGAATGIFFTSVGDSGLLRVVGVAMVPFGYFVPDLLLMSKGQERQKAIQLELANTLDQMLISVEAGLGFEGAMARAGENGKGPLAEEIIRTLQDMQVGRSRRESYLALTERTNVPELRSFVQSVVQADAYGIAIGAVLRIQAKVMRVKRRQRAEEKAMKLPVTVLFPLLFFIFPVLFIAILGPAVINSVETFSGG